MDDVHHQATRRSVGLLLGDNACLPAN
jgi:hypothetical protein